MRVFKTILLLTLILSLTSCSIITNRIISDVSDTVVEIDPEDGSGVAVKAETPGTMLDYFAEIAFDSEYGTSAGKLCRWETEILYKITGDATENDLELIDYLCETLNGIEGFPGIREAKNADTANFEIMFVSRDTIAKEFEHATDACTGMCEFSWTTDTYRIVSARAAIDSAETSERNSTICEEILQSMGLPNDSYTHRDSVFYEGRCVYNRPSELDFAMIRLLYHPSLRCGMTKKEALASAVDILQW